MGPLVAALRLSTAQEVIAPFTGSINPKCCGRPKKTAKPEMPLRLLPSKYRLALSECADQISPYFFSLSCSVVRATFSDSLVRAMLPSCLVNSLAISTRS